MVILAKERWGSGPYMANQAPGRSFNQQRELLPRKAMMVVMKRTTRQRGKRQGDKGLRAELALETPTATTFTRRGLRISDL